MKELKWLYEQLPDLIEKGIISTETADRLKTHYGALPTNASSTQNLTFIILGILGTVLIGAGIITVFAHNWDSFGRLARTVLSFLPLLIAQGIYLYTYFKKSDSIAWVEASSTFLMLMISVCIALIHQTYHLGFDDINSFLLTCLILSIPLMYLMNASLVTVLYLIGISSWLSSSSNFYHTNYDNLGIYSGLLLVALPHYFINLSFKKTTTRSILLGWGLIFPFAFSVFWAFIGSGIVYLVLIPLFYLIGKCAYQHPSNPIYRPFQTMALWCVFWLAYTLGFEKWDDLVKFPEDILLQIGWIYIPIIASIYLLVRRIQAQQYVNYFTLALPLVIVVGVLSTDTVAAFLSSAYLFLFGLYYLYNGLQDYKIGILNIGMLFICAVVITRFFDADVSLLLKGIVFILLGGGFLFANYWIFKNRKAV